MSPGIGEGGGRESEPSPRRGNCSIKHVKRYEIHFNIYIDRKAQHSAFVNATGLFRCPWKLPLKRRVAHRQVEHTLCK
jgi:hypothetical protein